VYESGLGVGVVLDDEDEDEDEDVEFECGDVVVEEDLGLGRGYPGNLIVKSNNDNTGLEETWTRRAIPCTF
jgi:hypothetical protein